MVSSGKGNDDDDDDDDCINNSFRRHFNLNGVQFSDSWQVSIG